LTQILTVIRDYYCNYWNAARILAPDLNPQVGKVSATRTSRGRSRCDWSEKVEE
jgi:hypothetical protein